MNMLVIKRENIKEVKFQQTVSKDFSLYSKEAWLACINIVVSNIYIGICTNSILDIQTGLSSALKIVSGLRSLSRARLGKRLTYRSLDGRDAARGAHSEGVSGFAAAVFALRWRGFREFCEVWEAFAGTGEEPGPCEPRFPRPEVLIFQWLIGHKPDSTRFLPCDLFRVAAHGKF